MFFFVYNNHYILFDKKKAACNFWYYRCIHVILLAGSFPIKLQIAAYRDTEEDYKCKKIKGKQEEET